MQPAIFWLAALIGMVCHQISNRIRNTAGTVTRNQRRGAVGRRRRGHRHHRRTGHAAELVAHVIALSFIGAKEKSFVLDDRPTERSSKLLQGAGILRARRLAEGAWIAGAARRARPRSRPPRDRLRAELTSRRDIGADLAALIGDAYEELSSRCFDINVPTAVRSSAIGEDSGTASFAGLFDTYLGVSGPDRVLQGGPPVLGQPVRRARGGLPAAGGHAPPGHADGRRRHRADPRPGLRRGVLAHPVTGKTDRIVIETSWGWGEAVVQGLVTPDHVEVGKADGRVLKYQVAAKTVVSNFDYAVGRVVETAMPARLVDHQGA